MSPTTIYTCEGFDGDTCGLSHASYEAAWRCCERNGHKGREIFAESGVFVTAEVHGVNIVHGVLKEGTDYKGRIVWTGAIRPSACMDIALAEARAEAKRCGWKIPG